MVSRIRGYCIDCGKGITGNKAIRCQKCNGIFKRKFKTKEEYARNWQLKKKYGLEPGEFDVWWQACRGKCFICKKSMDVPRLSRGQGLNVVAVDHDHKTGKIRGLLCNACNKGLGLFKDDVEILNSAIQYLEG